MIMEKKILLVDDEKDILKLLFRALSAKGYLVFQASSGKEALELLAEEQINVMFFDLNMHNMDGLELCRTVRKKYSSAKIMALTGYSTAYDIEECYLAGFDNYYTKPIRLSELFKAAEEAFEESK